MCAWILHAPWSGSGLMFWPQACVHRQHQRTAAPGLTLVFLPPLGKWALLRRLRGAFGSQREAGAPTWGLVCALDFGWQSLGILGVGAVSTCPKFVGDAGKWIVLPAEAPWMLVWWPGAGTRGLGISAMQPLLVLLSKARVAQGLPPLKRFISLCSGLLFVISVPFWGLVMCHIALGLGHVCPRAPSSQRGWTVKEK